MGVETAISWTDSTFNPWWGCAKIGPGCDNCYADAPDRRTGGGHWGTDAERRTFGDKHWNEPRRWNSKARAEGHRHLVFCASMADVFDNKAPEGQRDRLWALIRDTPALTWQIVTKRIGNAPGMLPPDWGDGYPNVWLLSTIVNQAEADRDIPKLLRVPARVHGLSMEPLLGPVDLSCIPWPAWSDRGVDDVSDGFDALRYTGGHLDWVIVGGESGAHARPLQVDWVADLQRQCFSAGTPFFFKQWGGRTSDKGGCRIGENEHKAWPVAA